MNRCVPAAAATAATPANIAEAGGAMSNPLTLLLQIQTIDTKRSEARNSCIYITLIKVYHNRIASVLMGSDIIM